jgi:hypothetical protein
MCLLDARRPSGIYSGWTWRLPEERTNQFYAKAEDFWVIHCKHSPALAEVKQSKDKEEVAGKYYDENAWLLLFGQQVCYSRKGWSNA